MDFSGSHDSGTFGAELGGSVRGLYIAVEQYSSFCVSAVVLSLGGDDIENGVPDREQVDCEREKVEEEEKQERDKHEETTNAPSNM